MAHVPTLRTDRLVLTIPSLRAAPRMRAFVEENRDHFEPWSPPPPEDFYTDAFWRERIAAAHAEHVADQSLRLVLLRRDDPDGPVIGDCNFTNFVRGAFQACYLGYKIDRRHVGQGLMREALTAALAHVFGELRLHRVMANYMPNNERSGRLLQRLGFTIEGKAKDYLFIAGAWRDHVLTSLTNPNPAPPN